MNTNRRYDESHFDNLQRLLTLERKEEQSRYEQLRTGKTIAEREQLGITLTDLELVEDRFGSGQLHHLEFEHATGKELITRISVGDSVEVHPRKIPTTTYTKAIGVVLRKNPKRITIAFADPAQNEIPEFVFNGRVTVDLSVSDVTYQRLQTAIEDAKKQFTDPKSKIRVLLLQRPAVFEPDTPLASTLNPEKLNVEQLNAAKKALTASDFFLVHGPPGTGKSTVLVEAAVSLARSKQKVVATAASNAAVDHLLDRCASRGLSVVRIGHPARVAERLHDFTLDALVEKHLNYPVIQELFNEASSLGGYARKQRSHGRSASRFANAKEAKIEARKLYTEAKTLLARTEREVIERADVVCSTCANLVGSELANRTFDVALFDEATQASEPLSLLPFLRAKTVILAGDHCQLPPTILSLEASSQGLSVSLFERLLKDHGRDVCLMLRQQYRMNAEIMEFPSKYTYDNQLLAHQSVKSQTLNDILTNATEVIPQVTFLDTAGKGFDDAVAEGTESYHNEGEADLLMQWLQRLLQLGLTPESIAVIAPYSAQVTLLRSLAKQRGLSEGIEIDTVDSFQGREKEAVLLSLTRSNSEGQVGFLADVRRFNVAITRAKRHLWVVGDSATISNHPVYNAFIEHTQTKGFYQSAWEWQIDS